MKRFSFSMAFGLGALTLIWVAVTVAGSHFLVLVMTALIAAVYGYGFLELSHDRATTKRLSQGLTQLPPDLTDLNDLNDWLITLPLGLQNTVSQRIEGERVGLPGPALTPYLTGLLVMLGMLGTFLGMVVTLNGTVFALEGALNMANIRTAFSEPIKGLGLAFGTSVAGVATSAMLGLMSNLARHERASVLQRLDTLTHTRLRHFSLTFQQQQSFKALAQQAQALPQVLAQLQALTTQMASSTEQLNSRLLANQQNFHKEAQDAYTGLAQSVDQSLRTSLNQSLYAATESIRPVVQATMAQLAEQTQSTNERLLRMTQQQFDALNNQIMLAAAALTKHSDNSLKQHDMANTAMTERLGQTLNRFSQNYEHTAQATIDQFSAAQAEQQQQQNSTNQLRLLAWQAAMEQTSAQLHSQWQTLSAQTLGQQKTVCETLAQTAQNITTHTQTQIAQTLADITRLTTHSESLAQTRIDSEAQWSLQVDQRSKEWITVLRTEMTALRDAEADRGQAALFHLSELQIHMTEQLAALGAALEAPITRLIETASEAPQAAAEVMARMREEISNNAGRDNALLEERTRILSTLNVLLDAIQHASTEQRGVIDALVNTSQNTLIQATGTFQTQVSAETDKLGLIAAQVTASAVDVASLGETFGFAVRSFSDSNDKLMGQLQRIEQALGKSMTRSDEQLAYYVAQAREIIDLSISSQKDMLDALQRRTDTVTNLSTEGAL